jgi:fumarate reductase subunit D
MPRRRVEPIVWLMFSAGGVLASLLLPVLVFLFALAYPLGWLSPPAHDHLASVVSNPVTFIVLLVVFLLLLVHSAHRFRYTLYDGLQIKQQRLIAVACYGTAVVGTVATVVVLVTAL